MAQIPWQDIPLIVLVGPTAVGKTAASIALAQKLGGEIISGDSMQIFRGFDIGTAKVKPAEMGGIPHHLLDIKAPDAEFSVAEFKTLVDQKIQEIAARGKVPILVGGTGLYINSIIYHYHFGDANEDKAYRATLTALCQRAGNEALVAQLQAVDPISAARIHLNDTKRLIRALEVYHVTGKPFSATANSLDKANPRYKLAFLALEMNREVLYQRINQRVDQMMVDGWLTEVQTLLASGVPPHCLAMQGLGYRQLVSHLQGELTLAQAIELIKRDTRHFAKRQFTWFRHDPHVLWVNKDGKSEKDVQKELLQNISRTIGLNVE